MTIDKNNFKDFFDRTFETLLKFVSDQSKGILARCDVEDITVESYYAVFKRLPELENANQAHCLLFLSARNLTANRLEQQSNGSDTQVTEESMSSKKRLHTTAGLNFYRHN
jgi:hypothetical protein